MKGTCSSIRPVTDESAFLRSLTPWAARQWQPSWVVQGVQLSVKEVCYGVTVVKEKCRQGEVHLYFVDGRILDGVGLMQSGSPARWELHQIDIAPATCKVLTTLGFNEARKFVRGCPAGISLVSTHELSAWISAFVSSKPFATALRISKDRMQDYPDGSFTRLVDIPFSGVNQYIAAQELAQAACDQATANHRVNEARQVLAGMQGKPIEW